MTAPSLTADREILTTRLISASRERVWSAWTDPAQVDLWWGPNGFITTTQKMDVRAGGSWSFLMLGPDGTEYPNMIEYEEVIEPERLVYLHGDGEANSQQSFHVTVTFEEQDGKTFLSMRAVFATKEALDYVVKEVGAIDGAKQTLNRLEEFVTK
jgi:uncharacterized protein YndB with AHSA1/START domain